MSELFDSYTVAKTLRNGGKVEVGDLGYLTAKRRHTHILDYDEDGKTCVGYRVTKSKYVVMFTPSSKLQVELS